MACASTCDAEGPAVFECDAWNKRGTSPSNQILALFHAALDRLPDNEAAAIKRRFSQVANAFPAEDSDTTDYVSWMQLAGLEFGLWTAVALYSSITKSFMPTLVFVIYNGSVSPGPSRKGAALIRAGYPSVLAQMNDTCGPTKGKRSPQVCSIIRELRNEIFRE